MRSFIIGISLALILFACSSVKPTQEAGVDKEFNTAVEQAHQSLDVFVKNLQSPKPTQSLYALKVHFDYPDGTSEEIWVDEVYYDNGKFTGVLFDASSKNLGYKNGDKINIPEEDILDWMFLEDNVLVGGYTIRLAYQRMTPQEKETFLKDAQYKLE
jgi:uncharacterized protein YegJ (DUF2314 family)